MKKYTALFSVLLLVLFMAGCGGSKDEPVEEPDEQQIEQADQPSDETIVEETGEETEVETETAGSEPTAAPAKTNFNKTPLEGMVVSFSDLVMGGSGKVNPVKAKKLANKGYPIVVKTGNGRIYWVYNSDGTFAGKKLARYAGNDVSVYGKAKRVDNLNVIIASRITK